MFRKFFVASLTVLSLSLAAGAARADSVVIDPVGDFLSTYAGPHNGDMDIISTQVSLLGTNFVFSATLNAPIGTTPGAFYVWGIDRGTRPAPGNFSPPPPVGLGLDIPHDAVVRINQDGSALVGLLTAGQPPSFTPLPPGSITISGNSFQAIVPVSFLPSRGFTAEEYGQNLWVRCCGVPMGIDQISDFAPDDRDAGVTVVPEPATLLLLGTGLAGVALKVHRRRK